VDTDEDQPSDGAGQSSPTYILPTVLISSVFFILLLISTLSHKTPINVFWRKMTIWFWGIRAFYSHRLFARSTLYLAMTLTKSHNYGSCVNLKVIWIPREIFFAFLRNFFGSKVFFTLLAQIACFLAVCLYPWVITAVTPPGRAVLMVVIASWKENNDKLNRGLLLRKMKSFSGIHQA